jgi:DNA mismatch repair ATPase MutS
MLQLGMFVPASTATISVSDGIFTHFPTGADDTIDKGRLGEECARLRDIFDNVTDKSFVLLDESLSSTGSYEASYIAAEVLAGLSRIGCRCLFSTHLHELASEIDNINARTAPHGGNRIDTLVAGIEDGKRSFKIQRAKPDGKSYARDIAESYGLTYERIIRKLFDMRPAAIVETLGLKNPGNGWCYRDTASYGHFGRAKFPWERTDRVDDLRAEVKA